MVKSKKYVPEKGDIVWLDFQGTQVPPMMTSSINRPRQGTDFNPQLGHEQRGRRPALTLSAKSYNEKIGLALFCPITSKIKGYPFEIQLNSKKITGSVLSDQIKSLDWTQRNIEFIEKVEKETVQEVIENVNLIMEG